MTALIVHGGCGIWLPQVEKDAIAGCTEAVKQGREILTNNGTALDAVIAACVSLENNPTFNSGTGSVLNYDGQAQMDASLMEGHTLRFGAVAAIERVQNPILVAKDIIEKTDHTLLAGTGATHFANQVGHPDYDARTSARIAEHKFLRAKVPTGELKTSQYSSGHPEHTYTPTQNIGSITTGTVGAVAQDSHGNFAAATSTGGILLKLPGRVGDTALPGSGTYANTYGAASSTGTGEYVMKILGTRQFCDRIQSGQTAQQAIDAILDQIQTLFSGQTGMIGIDHNGSIGLAHRTPEMPHAFFSGDRNITARIRAAAS